VPRSQANTYRLISLPTPLLCHWTLPLKADLNVYFLSSYNLHLVLNFLVNLPSYLSLIIKQTKKFVEFLTRGVSVLLLDLDINLDRPEYSMAGLILIL